MIIVSLGPFINAGSGEESGWSLRLRRRGKHVVLGLHWGDKEEPTHEYSMTVEEFDKSTGLIK